MTGPSPWKSLLENPPKDCFTTTKVDSSLFATAADQIKKHQNVDAALWIIANGSCDVQQDVQPGAGSTPNPDLTCLNGVVGAVKALPIAISFRYPFGEIWPRLLDEYQDKIERPIDLTTIERKIRHREYRELRDFKEDVAQLHRNAIIYYGAENLLTQDALEVKRMIFRRSEAVLHQSMA